MSNALRIAYGEFGRVALLDMDASLVRHAHPQCHVLIKAKGADTHFMVGDAKTLLTDLSAVLINAWEPHAYLHDPIRPRTVILALYIEPRWLSFFRPNWAASGAPGFFEQTCGRITPRIRRWADELSALMLDAPAARAMQERLVSQLMIAVIEQFVPWRTISLRDFEKSSWIDWRIRKALATIRCDPSAISDITSLARASGLSRAHFFRLFERSVRVTPRVFLNVVRMETAVSDVMRGDVPMAEVSGRLGFSAPPHFTRFFRDHAGAAPSEFRAIARMQGQSFETARQL